MRIHRVLVLSIALPACGSAPPPTNPPVAQIDVAPPPAPPETQFRGYVTIDAVPLAGQTLDDRLEAIGRTAHGATKELLPCLRHEEPKPIDVWIVGRVSEQGRVELVQTEKSVPVDVARCVNAVVGALKFDDAPSFALSMVLRGEPAPGDCERRSQESDDCTLIPLPDGNAHDDDAGTTAPQGMIGLLNTGGDSGNVGVLGTLTSNGSGIGDAFGAGGLGLTGLGEGAGGRGEGIGLGSVGTIGHGGGLGSGEGFGNGHVRLSGSHRGKVPSVRMGATSVSGRLPPEVIQRIVRQNFGRFRLCYENGLRKNPALEGAVNTTFVIGKTGDVIKVADAKSDLKDASVVQCVQKSFAHLSFPAPEGGIVTVMYPVHFEPGKEPPPPPVFTVGGEHFPVLTSESVEKKLSSAGWRTMSVSGRAADPNAPTAGDAPKAPFAIFAIKSGASMNPMERPSGFLTTALWEPETGAWRRNHRDSEAFRLSFDGDQPDVIDHDLVDPEPIKPGADPAQPH